MITPKNIIYTAMYNKGIKSIKELNDLMNEGSDRKYDKANTSNVVNGNQILAHYMRRIEQVLGFADKSLLNMYEESNGPRANKD